MSTSCIIYRKNTSGDYGYDGIYCHWDGYTSFVGRILCQFYNTDEKVDELISYGDLSSLGSKISPEEGENHSFDNPVKDVCVFYHRDRGYKWEDCKPLHSMDAYFPNGVEYIYKFEDGEWYFKHSHYDEDWKLVKEASSK